MTKKSVKGRKEIVSAEIPDLTRASTEDKRVFWDFFCREIMSDLNPPAYHEQIADVLIANFEVFINQLHHPQRLHSIAGLVDLVRLQIRAGDLVGMLRKRKSEREPGEIPDLTKSSPEAKRHFWDVLQKSMEFLGPAEAYREDRADIAIKLYSKIVKVFGPVDDLQELTEVMFTLMKLGFGYVLKDTQLTGELDALEALDALDSFKLPEDSAVLDAMADEAGKAMEEIVDEAERKAKGISERFGDKKFR